MTCIFCKAPAAQSSTSHILPASLGGGQWACLPDGLVCSQCNQYFGEKVEKLALSSYPFLPFRVSLGIPTRKRRAPKMETHLGAIVGTAIPGVLGLDPADERVEEAIVAGKITQVRVLAEPTEPVAVCRMLVKMGLEVVAQDSADDARSEAFDAARTFARNPKVGSRWWFAMATQHGTLFQRFCNGISLRDWAEGVSLSVHRFDEFEAFRLQLLDMVIFSPLDHRVLPPDMREFPEPDHRLYLVQV